jgi:hypothetical protein
MAQAAQPSAKEDQDNAPSQSKFQRSNTQIDRHDNRESQEPHTD